MLRTSHLATYLTVALALTAGAARGQVTASPSQINFSTMGINQFRSSQITLTNAGAKSVSVTAFVFDSPSIGLYDGVFPHQMSAGGGISRWSVAFKAGASAGTHSGKITISFQGAPNLVVPYTATVVKNTGFPSVNVSSINFGNVALGTSATQNITVTNTGSQSFVINALQSYEPFSVSALSTSLTLAPQKSVAFQATFSPIAAGAVTGFVTIGYNYFNSTTVDLAGTGVKPSGLAITSFPTLPAATQGAPYQNTLLSVGGTPPYRWAFVSGNKVQGLSLASSGRISGTVASTMKVGNYSSKVQVTDSSTPPKTATAVVTIPVGAPTGSNCNNISVNITGTKTPAVAISDLGTGTYKGYEGGLYSNGSSFDPAGHQASAVAIANAIQPRDADGNPDPTNGSYALIALGVSATEQPFIDFINVAGADPAKNSHLVLVNGGLGGETARDLSSYPSDYWDTILQYVVPYAGVTPEQVAVAWVNIVDSSSLSFPANAQTLQASLEAIAQNLHTIFPHLVLAYFGSLNYTGYSNGVATTNPEPQGYESAFANKWAIQDQINGDPNLNFSPSAGPVLAPWMGWGPYYWANGLLTRNDGTYWSCQDLTSDGVHPVYPGGHMKIVQALLNFFKSDPTAIPWYVAPTQKK